MPPFPRRAAARGSLLAAALLALLTGSLLPAQTATIAVSTSAPQTLKRKLTGCNNGDYRTAYDLGVTDYSNRWADLRLGWARWYSGTVSNAFHWAHRSCPHPRGFKRFDAAHGRQTPPPAGRSSRPI